MMCKWPETISRPDRRQAAPDQEAGTYPGRAFIENANAENARVFVPTGAGGKQIHIILEVRDQNPIAALRDYHRVVIDVEDQILEIESSQNEPPVLASNVVSDCSSASDSYSGFPR